MADQAAIDQIVDRLHWLGHDAFRLDRPQGPVYFDPFQISPGPPASLILVSHDHFDHCSPEDVAKIQGPDTVIITEANSAAKLSGQVLALAPGQTLDVAGVKIQALPAYNTDKDFHPKANQWLGFLISVDGVSIYHAGDTDHIPEMEGLKTDIALLPVSGTYVMTAEQAVEAAKAISPKLAIPMHYGAIVGDQSDADRFAQALEGVVPVRVLPKE
ncbi:MAG: MBL fold metallo-hydrolase [Desulfarculaceae bacterium]|jgi:L-ascorbate metabolism protein UlaG (beta-lactamase superfamily)